jgi:hypothetical protein
MIIPQWMIEQSSGVPVSGDAGVRSNPATSENRQLASCLNLGKGFWQAAPDVAHTPQTGKNGEIKALER